MRPAGDRYRVVTLPMLRAPTDRPTAGRSGDRRRADAPPPGWLQRPVLGRSADRDLAGHLERETSELGVVLHDVVFAGAAAPVDHIVIAPSGIWLVDSLRLRGRIERRAPGAARTAEPRLHLDGVDRTDLVDELRILRHAQSRLRTLGVGDAPVHRVVCVIDGTWPVMGRPFQVHDVWITWPRALTDKIRSSGLLPIARARAIGAALAAPAAR